jgi:hypothetical protein
LLNKYGLPEYSIENEGKKWKTVLWREVKIKVNIKWKEIELDIWWRYDENGKLDYTIYTFYPSK